MIRSSICGGMRFVAILVVAGIWHASAAHAALISYWAFEDGSGQAVSDSVGSNHGTLGANNTVNTDDPAWTGSGKFGGALNFDGTNDRVRVPHSASLNVSAVTMAAWVNLDTAKRHAVIDKSSDFASGNGLHMRVGISLPPPGDTLLRSFVGNAGAAVSDSTLSVPLSTWAHVAAVHNGSTLTVYVNGVPNTPVAASIINNTTELGLGGSLILGATNSLDGRMDDAGFWNHGLTTPQVRALYSLGSEPDLGYTLLQAQSLFDLFAAQTGSVEIDGLTWTYATGLSSPLGDVTTMGSNYYLQLAANGTGLTAMLPIAPEPSSLWLLGFGMLALRRRSQAHARCK